MRSSCGVYLYIKLISKVFKNTLLPVPVAPATKRCGILVKSRFTGLPTKSLPKQKVSEDFLAFLNPSAITSSLSPTVCGEELGTSMPMRVVPVIGATILILPFAASQRFKSSCFSSTFLIEVDVGMVSSKRVSAGPYFTSTICASIFAFFSTPSMVSLRLSCSRLVAAIAAASGR